MWKQAIVFSHGFRQCVIEGPSFSLSSQQIHGKRSQTTHLACFVEVVCTCSAAFLHLLSFSTVLLPGEGHLESMLGAVVDTIGDALCI